MYDPFASLGWKTHHIKAKANHAREIYPEENETEHELEVDGDSKSVSPPPLYTGMRDLHHTIYIIYLQKPWIANKFKVLA